METKTFRELYFETKEQPTPTQLFLDDIAKLSRCKVATVRSWALSGITPGKLTQAIVSQHLGIPADKLFPKKK
jgi:hypothetical protein